MEFAHHFKEYSKIENTQKNRVLNSIIVFACLFVITVETIKTLKVIYTTHCNF